MNRRIALGLLASLTLIALPQLAAAQAFPGKPIKFIVPFPAGGINDILARIIADKLQAKWGQPIIIEQRTGAGGNIGADLTAQAEPDGHTILVAPPGPLAINGSLYKKLTYKPEDFVPITMIGSVPNVTIVKKELPVNMFMNMTGTDMVHVPYRGEVFVLQDMLGGRVDLFFGNVSAALPHWRDGKVKVLAVLDKTRAVQMPDVPTTAEAGMPDLVSTGWFAAAGPPKMAPALRDRLAADFNEVLKMPDVQQKIRNTGVEPVGGSPAETAAFIKTEAQRWGEVIRKNNIVVD
jgi:tripartite-type tricarboxylate transporter receptor subunit TctC